MSQGVYVLGVKCPRGGGGICPWGKCLGGTCPGGGGGSYVLEPLTKIELTVMDWSHFHICIIQ